MGVALEPKDTTGKPELSDEETTEIISLLAQAHEAAEQVIAAQDRNLRLLRANNRKLAGARQILTDSNRMATTRRRTFAK